jgi:branched-chain amino acid transport system substrate-binding protein
MNLVKAIAAVACAGAALLSAGSARAEGTIKVGLVAEFSGPFAGYGKQIQNGIKAYMKQHGDTVAGKKVELVLKDTTGPSPEIAKRLAQDLITHDKVDFIAGFGLTPNALAVAPLATQAKTPMIIMNAASSIITTKSPYIARFSMTLPQVTEPIALWSAKNGIKKVFTIVSDYAPGLDAENAFVKSFSSQGGEVVGSVRVPLRNPDFAPFVQRAKDAKPDAVFIFVPAGEQGIAFVKAFTERGLRQAGIKLIGPGDVVDDDVLEAMGDPTLGIITTHHYSAAHDSPENAAFRKAYAEANGEGTRPNFMAVAGYDGMAAIYEVARKLGGTMDADRAMEVLKGLKLNSPRGPIRIDPETRDIVQTVYVRRVERVKGGLYNVEFDKFPDVKDPGKPAN